MASARGMSLSFIAPAVREGKPVVQLREEVVEEEFNEWQNALILYVPGETSWTVSSMISFLEQEWNMVAKPTLVFHEEDGYFSVKFDTLDDRNTILCSGPYYIGGKPMIMKPWTSDLRFEKEVFMSSIPVWVQLPNLPLNFWGGESLSRIGSVIGKPLYADECTIKKSRISYARVLIDTDITKPLPDSVTIADPSTGKTFVQKAVFEWIPALGNDVQVLNACAGAEPWPKHKNQQQNALPKYANPVSTTADMKKKADEIVRLRNPRITNPEQAANDKGATLEPQQPQKRINSEKLIRQLRQHQEALRKLLAQITIKREPLLLLNSEGLYNDVMH
ncbi:uncharacterized protein LOC141610899 [Silene latifolia]|uniref:uncharacterized protein LOC141610899 n=1 Tax=Silene latifolia TaxID=37657 RepID=UPI003D78411D